MRSSSQSRHRPLLSTAGIIPTLFLTLSTLLQPALAGPYPKDDLHDTVGSGFLQDASCASYCGAQNEHCCSQDEVCATSNSVAACTSAAPLLVQRDDSSWALYTTTWTETETFTSTYSSAWAAATTTTASGSSGSGGTCVPPADSGEIACGSICCASWQYCAYDGQCVSNAAATTTDTAATTSYSVYPTTVTSDGTTVTTQYSAPYRVTGTGTASTSTATAEGATGTGSASGNGTALATTSGSHLSGGAIAGIVIGSVLGVALLIGICACCLVRGLWHGLLALLGLGGSRDKRRNRSRETIIVEEERYSRHGGTPRTTRTVSHADRDRHTSWFSGARPAARSSAAESRRVSEKNNKESNQTSWWTAGALGTLLVLLGLRRDRKRRQSTAKRSSRPRSTVSSSYFTESEDVSAGSPSEFSSDYTYSSVYTPVQSQHPRGPRTASVVRSHSVRSASAAGGGRYRDDYDHPKSNLPPDYAVSASSGGRTRDARRSRRSETTRISRASSRR